jgi:hypothetical protein
MTLRLSPDTLSNSTPRFGRFATDAEKKRIMTLARAKMPARKLDPRFILVQKELHIPLTRWRIPIITRLFRFLSEFYDHKRVFTKAKDAGLKTVPIVQLATHLTDPQEFIGRKRKVFEEVLKHYPNSQFAIGQIKDTSEVLSILEFTMASPAKKGKPKSKEA